MKTLYSARLKDGNILVTKFDEDIELLKQYKVTLGPKGTLTCDCPQAYNRKALCRHVQMLNGNFIPAGHIGDGYLLCYETGEWTEPPL